jgi:hypothetical protein
MVEIADKIESDAAPQPAVVNANRTCFSCSVVLRCIECPGHSLARVTIGHSKYYCPITSVLSIQLLNIVIDIKITHIVYIQSSSAY